MWIALAQLDEHYPLECSGKHVMSLEGTEWILTTRIFLSFGFVKIRLYTRYLINN